MRNSKNEVPNFPCHAIGEEMCSVEESNLSDSKIFSFFFGCAGSSLLHGLFSVVVSGDYALVVTCGLLTAVASFVSEHGLCGA